MEPLVDRAAPRSVLSSEVAYTGAIWDVLRDHVDLGPAGAVYREYVRHPGAVAVLALDDADRVLLLRQYRHPVRSELWELPAGLLDVDGEDPRDAAARELAEEADLRAARWHELVDYFSSPGGSDEMLRVYLARDLSPVPAADRHAREAEESEIVVRWTSLEQAVSAILAGQVRNPGAVVGILAAHAARERDWSSLRECAVP